MKLNTLDHPKTLDLCDRLSAGLAQTLGHLTLLWAFTARKSPRGDVGKWTDGAIARACDWQGDSAAFVNALVESGFLDRDDRHRLIVHDWAEHAERWVRASLKKMEQSFITDATTEKTTESTNDATPCPDQPCPDQPKARARKHALPPDFVPKDSHRKLAAEVGADLLKEFDQFRDYHLGKGSMMVDWNRTLNTWLRNAKKFGGNKSADTPKAKQMPDYARMPNAGLQNAASRLGVDPDGMQRDELITELKRAWQRENREAA